MAFVKLWNTEADMLCLPNSLSIFIFHFICLFFFIISFSSHLHSSREKTMRKWPVCRMITEGDGNGISMIIMARMTYQYGWMEKYLKYFFGLMIKFFSWSIHLVELHFCWMMKLLCCIFKHAWIIFIFVGKNDKFDSI